MITMTCPKCYEGDVEFDMEEGSNGPDGLGQIDTWWYAIYASHNCGCELTDVEIEQLQEEASAQWRDSDLEGV